MRHCGWLSKHMLWFCCRPEEAICRGKTCFFLLFFIIVASSRWKLDSLYQVYYVDGCPGLVGRADTFAECMQASSSFALCSAQGRILILQHSDTNRQVWLLLWDGAMTRITSRQVGQLSVQNTVLNSTQVTWLLYMSLSSWWDTQKRQASRLIYEGVSMLLTEERNT